MLRSLPLIFFPTTIIWVDDDKLLLQIVPDQFKNGYQVRVFDSASSCINFFKTYHSLFSHQNFLRGYVEHDDYDSANHAPIDMNIRAISSLAKNKDKSNEISILIADYYMPDINGIELGQRITLPIKKILLTGEVDDKQAIEAFNDGHINKFIRKGDISLVEQIQRHIELLSEQYFCEQTSALLSMLETDKKLPLSDPHFVKFFQQWRKENHIQEYYLTDKRGSLLMINSDGEEIYFIIHTDTSLRDFIQMHDENDSAQEFINDVMSHKKIPFFGIDKESWQIDVRDWAKYFHTPNILEGREKYYWAITKG